MNMYDVYDGTEKVAEAAEWSDGYVTMHPPRLSLGWGASMDAMRGRFPGYTFVPHGSPPPEPDTGGWRVRMTNTDEQPPRHVYILTPGFVGVALTTQQARNLADKIRAVADEADGS